MRQLLWLALAGCLESVGPDLGPELPACSPADSDPDLAISYQADVVTKILQRYCYSCHTNDGVGITIGGFDMSSYTALRAGGTNTGTDVIVDGDPCNSVIVQKLGEAPPFGARMPRGGPFLDVAERQLIADWIAEGAIEN